MISEDYVFILFFFSSFVISISRFYAIHDANDGYMGYNTVLPLPRNTWFLERSFGFLELGGSVSGYIAHGLGSVVRTWGIGESLEKRKKLPG